MKNFFKNISIFILLLAVSTPLLLGFLSYKIQLKSIKKQVKQELIENTSKADLVAFEFDVYSQKFKNLKWKHSREFEFNNKMFDIVEADTIDNKIHYLCFPDKQETELNAKFKALLKSRYAQEEPLNNNINLYANFIKSLYLDDIVSFQFFSLEKELEYNLYACFLITRKEKVPTPPPLFI